jgi:hypothetical protein
VPENLLIEQLTALARISRDGGRIALAGHARRVDSSEELLAAGLELVALGITGHELDRDFALIAQARAADELRRSSLIRLVLPLIAERAPASSVRRRLLLATGGWRAEEAAAPNPFAPADTTV